MSGYLADQLCGNCQAAGLEVQTEASAVCRYCGTANAVSGVICPHCEWVNAEGAQACDGCHQTLVRRCSTCNTPNWAGAERCMRCQKPLDAVASLSARYQNDTASRLRAQQREAPSLKAKEEADSRRRMADLNAIEERRQDYLHQAVQARDSQQRIWIGLLIGLGFIVIVATIIGLALFVHS